MNSDAQNLPYWAQAIVLLFAIGAAVFERIRSMKLAQGISVSTAKDELVKVITADRDTWKSRYESEHGEFVARRQQYHDEANKMQTRMLVLTEENAMLKAKTDVSPIMTELRAVSEINQKVLEGLTNLTNAFYEHEAHCEMGQEQQK